MQKKVRKRKDENDMCIEKRMKENFFVPIVAIP